MKSSSNQITESLNPDFLSHISNYIMGFLPERCFQIIWRANCGRFAGFRGSNQKKSNFSLIWHFSIPNGDLLFFSGKFSSPTLTPPSVMRAWWVKCGRFAGFRGSTHSPSNGWTRRETRVLLALKESLPRPSAFTRSTRRLNWRSTVRIFFWNNRLGLPYYLD